MKLLIVLLYTTACRCFCKHYAWHAVAFLFTVQFASAQNFTVNAIPQHELCPGNGSLTLSSSNAAPNVAVNYKVYLLPNTTTPIFNSTGTQVNNLNDGIYYIVATQIVNGNTIQDSIQVQIEDQTVPLQYSISSSNAMCGPDGSLTVTTLSGNAVSYEIIAGPVTRPLQSSNVFAGIPTGNYSVRVTDNCGIGIVTVHYVDTNYGVLVVNPGTFPDIELPGCDLITAAHEIGLLENDMVPQTPLTTTMTVYPPDGSAPLTYTSTVFSLDPNGLDLFQVIPFYYNTPYYYDLEIVDACGIVYNVNDNLVHQAITIEGGAGDAGCPGKYLRIVLTKYVSPYTIVFNSWPEGFDPEELNPAHPGPFTGNVTEYGSEEDDIAAPYGTYNVTVTDACGRTRTMNILLEETEVEAMVSPFSVNCLSGLGGVEVVVPGFYIVQATITQAPAEYGAFPDDVSEYINEQQRLEMLNLLPVGDYEVVVIDKCGREFTKTFTISFSEILAISPNVRVDCAKGFATAKLSGPTPITKVIITQAPAQFNQPLPHNASYNINPVGQWYMNNLPPGTYKFLVDDGCTTDFEVVKTLAAYTVSQDELTITRHCGSFDFYLAHNTTSSIFQFYGLQKEISPGQWGHPETGEAYIEGTEPSNTTAVPILPNTSYNTLTYTGNFRVIKYFEAFGTGRQNDDYPDTVDCIEILHEFNFYDDLQLISIVSLTCSGDVADVQVNVQGAAPINFSIISQDGEPVNIYNGENNIFTGLASAQYVVYFEDPCGNFITQPFNVADLPSLVTAANPGNLELCDNDDNGNETFNLGVQTQLVLDGQDPASFTVTYHASAEDAETGNNPLPLNYTTPTAIIYARVLNNNNTSCHALAMFDVIVREKPQIEMEDSYSICQGEDVTIYAPEGYQEYRWNGVALSRAITVAEGGTYTLEVTDEYGCTATKNLIVAASQAPSIATIEISDWTDASNTITVIVYNSPSAQYFEYSLDGVNYQPGNVFTGLAPGPYTVYVRDIYDCGNDTGEVYLLTYPRFFTPNGDGINETWRIQFSHMEPDMLIYIYDRYGKLVSSFDANSLGWDGTYNGHRLPATDYWFVVKRQDGKEYKGHFSMIR